MALKKSKKPLFSGERMQNHPDSELYQISFARYQFAQNYLSLNDTVLDIACGSGYGTNYLSKFCKKIMGVDTDLPTIKYCLKKYKNKNINFKLIEPNQSDKLLTNKFTKIISFETIEHTENGIEFLKTLKSYLKKKGTIIISTPNNYRHIHPPENKFHVKEFELNELTNIVNTVFPKAKYTIQIFGQQPLFMSNQSSKSKPSIAKSLIITIFKKAYNIDQKYLHLLQKIEHKSLYKKISKLQKVAPFSPAVYPIDLKKPYQVPTISIFNITQK